MPESRNWLRIGVGHKLQIVVFEPLFEEYNRTRRMLVTMARTLDAVGIGVTFPDLSGMGESYGDLATVRLADWRGDAAAAIAEIKPVVIASVRGGALLDDCAKAKGWWRFAPETGARIVRDLRRTQLAGESGLYAGHRLSSAFLGDLETTVPAHLTPLRIVRLDSDASDADITLPGRPLWRRAEPGEDATLSAALASDLADWTRQCAAG